MKKMLIICCQIVGVFLVGLLLSKLVSFSYNVEVYGSESKKSVLFISSYSEDFLSVPDQIKGVRSVLSQHNIQVFVEFMDTKRFETKESELAFYNLIKYKLEHTSSYEAIIVGDDSALQFAMDYQDDLFANIPIIFLGVNDFDRASLANSNKYITGVIETHFIKENIELGLKFNKQARKVVAIVDNTVTGIGDKDQFYLYEDEFDQLTFSDLNVSEYSFLEIESVLNEIDQDTILLYLSMYKDKTGANILIEEAATIISKNSNVPVYRAVVGGVGNGILGGKMVSYTKSGEIAANMVMDYLQGKPIEEIEMVDECPYDYVFDYNIIQKFNINEELIPGNAVLMNNKLSFYEQNKSLVRNTLVIIIFLCVLSFILTLDNIKQRKIEKQLKESHEELSQIYEELTASEEEIRAQYETVQGHLNEIQILNQKFEHRANHDYLTDLPNRRSFINRLNEEIKQGQPGAVLLLDIDNFKKVNDTLGHVYGDKMIKDIANKLSKISCEKVHVSRFGGDEFIILISNEEDIEKIKKLIEIIKMKFDEALLINYEEVIVSFSMGISRFPYDSLDVDQLIMNADTAMYKVKNAYKNNYLFYDSQMQKELIDKTEIESILRKAIKQDGFTLVYQPQVNVITGEIVGFEALLRLKDYNISPAKFIIIAEETGLITEIGRWVTREAINQIALWKEKGLGNKPVAINFSSKQLRDIKFIEFLQDTLTQKDVDPKYIEIEITESFLLEKTDKSLNFLNELIEKGIKIALDDFGTGYSSLSYLTFMPVHKIKLDKSLCEKFLGMENVKVMNSLISLAHNLNLQITAEGIEEVEQYNRLKDGGCDVIQGYLFSKPVGPDEIERIFNKNMLSRLNEKG